MTITWFAMSDIKAKKIPGQNDPVMSKEEMNTLVISLLEGSVETDNDVVKYFIDKLKVLETEGVQLTESLNQGQQQLKEIGKRLSAVMCEAGTYKKDLVEWYQRSTEGK
ncbi:unnamed protein product [marine sediment metagenome]|uniref:Uncharacterized protein n=1 Tax=marine sediment metagenome TaxID=412755 RepID=X0XH52_9ZZZZ